MKHILLIILIFVPSLSSISAAPPPKITASIKPIHSLISAVTAGVTTPALLIDGTTSLHDYMLKPSDARNLESSDIIFYVDNDLETFMTNVKNRMLIELSKISDVLPQRMEYIFSNKLETNSSKEKDIHLWLDPQNAKKIVAYVGTMMSKIDSDNTAIYQKNTASTLQKLDDLIKEITLALQHNKNQPYIVTHDAYQYFEKSFGLNAIATMSVNEELAINIKAVSKIIKMVKAERIKCVFSESSDDRLIQKLSADKSLKLQVLDPVGLGLSPGKDAYFTMMRALYQDFNRCFDSVNRD